MILQNYISQIINKHYDKQTKKILSNFIILETIGYPCNTSIEDFPELTSGLSTYT